MALWQHLILHPHQTWPANVMACDEGVDRLLLFYRVGTGKTFSALYAIHMLDLYWKQNPLITQFPLVHIMAPAKTLTEVWETAISLLKLSREKFILYSFEMGRRHYREYVASLREIRRSHQENNNTHPYHTILIIDESHTLRNTSSSSFHAAFAIASEVNKLLLLTGTPMVNNVGDMQSQLRLLTDDNKVMLKENKFVLPRSQNIMQTKYFASLFRGFVLTHLIPLHAVDYPSTDRTTHTVPMYDLQKRRYLDFDAEMLTPALRALMREGVIVTALNSFLTRTRAISNTVGKYVIEGEVDSPEKSAKFQGIRDSLINNEKPAVVYSFYLENGVLPLRKFIDSTTDLRTALLTGETTQKELKRIIEDNNVRRNLDVIFMTSAVRQGITLLRVRNVHIMEPGWNESLQEQVIGRVVRYKSHADLPKEDRHVQIHFWITTLDSGRRISTDQYTQQVADKKMQVIEKFEDILGHLKPPRPC